MNPAAMVDLKVENAVVKEAGVMALSWAPLRRNGTRDEMEYEVCLPSVQCSVSQAAAGRGELTVRCIWEFDSAKSVIWDQPYAIRQIAEPSNFECYLLHL